MINVEHNIWKLFYSLLLVSLVFLCLLLYNLFQTVATQHYIKLETYNHLASKGIYRALSEKDFMLSVAGDKLLSIPTREKQREYLDKLLKDSPSLVAFGLMDLKGNLLVSSSNLKLPKNTNIFTSKSKKYYFKKTLESHSLILGRTYYFKPLKTWAIPLRKTIRDVNGKALAVLTTAFINEGKKNFLAQLDRLKDSEILIVKDLDYNKEFYRQYSKVNRADYTYTNPVDEKIVQNIKKEILAKYNFTFDDMRTNKQLVSFSLNGMYGEDSFGSMVYDKKYAIWILVRSEGSVLTDEFLRRSTKFVLFYFVSFIILFFLFNKMHQAEKIKIEQLCFQAEHDVLTLLKNRTYMYQYIEEWKSNFEEFDVLFLDLDNFKNINDKFGHSVGDEILIRVAKRLTSIVDSDDMLIRQGGDEFIIICKQISSGELEKKLNNLIFTISELYKINYNEFRIGVSIGVSSCPKDSCDFEELLSFADTALYEAKKHKNSFSIFSQEMRSVNTYKSDIEQELRGGLSNGEFWMVYQPQINIDGSVYGVEALIRWKNKNLGFIGPDVFIAVAEQTGMMKELGTFITTKALSDIKSVYEQVGMKFSLSINISVIQFMDDNFLKNLLDMIQTAEFDKSLLTLEITESLSLDDLSEIVPLLNAIRQEGIEISLDDFGTGYSSLSILKSLPITELKIDKSFIDTIIDNETEKLLVKNIINIGKNFRMKLLAEGVESKEQLDVLKELNCDIIQGYYYSKPLSFDELIEYLKKDVS